jgi:hypothetical protein
MKNAIVAAIVAALVASGGTLAATNKINGLSIKAHSIPVNRLTTKAVNSFTVANTNSTATPLTTVPQTFTAQCPSGELATGGGFTTSPELPVTVISDGASSDGSSWDVVLQPVSQGESHPEITVNVSCQ